MKVLLEHLDWELGTKGPHSDLVDKTFLGLCIVSNVSKWLNLLLKMGQKCLSLASVLRVPKTVQIGRKAILSHFFITLS